MEKTKKQLLVYIIITFALTWTSVFTLVRPAALGTGLTGKVQLLVACCMFFPSMGVVLTRLITGEGFQNTMLRPRLRGNGKYYLLALVGPGLLALAGSAVYFLVFPGKLDLTFGYLREAMAAAGAPYEVQAVPIGAIVAIQTVQALLLGGVVNLIPSLGEEWGWRGYMYPRLAELMGHKKAVLLGGVIWGLWHAPLTALGHNYGMGYPGFPWTGIAAMCLFCTALGTLLHWLTEKTGSCIPAAVAHGAVNGAGALGTLFTADGGNPFVGPALTGLLSGVPVFLLAILAARHLIRRERQKREE